MYKKMKFKLARDCLRYIINLYSIKTMYIPYYLCNVIRHSLVEEGCKPIFYHIDDEFFPMSEFSEHDFILYPNYWGICGHQVKKMAEKYPLLIVDNAHAFFDEPNGLACFNAGHKFNFKDSFLWIKGRKNYFSNLINPYFENNDTILKRQDIFIKLHQKYKNINKLKINLDSKAPFCYPCLISNIEHADKLVNKLKEDGKTVYRYWDNLPKSFNEYKFYSRLVPIPILPYIS